MNPDFYTVFTRANLVFLLWFLAVYVLLSFIVGIFGGKNAEQDQQLSSRFFDVIMFVIGFLFIANVIFYGNSLFNIFNATNFSKLDDPSTLLAGLLNIFVFYLLIFIFGISMRAGVKSLAVSLYEFIAWTFVLIVSMCVFLKYALNITLTDGMYEAWHKLVVFFNSTDLNAVANNVIDNTNKLATDIAPQEKNEVFNIRNNSYTYEDARNVCSSYGARLASYDEIEKSYNDGGEWCNYGWSEGQMIFYPTQKKTWENLQKNPKTKNNCGRPGINGGYIDNPNVKFGVNCYGKRPEPTTDDLELMDAQKQQIPPTTHDAAKLDDNANTWKQSANKINSFNHEKWSAY